MSNRVAGNLLGIICMVAWSTNFVVADDLLQSWHPVLLTPVRSGVAAVVLGLVVVIIGQGRQLLQIPVIYMAGAGGLGLSVSNLLFVWGQYYVDPVSAAIILSALPAVSLAFGWFAGTERLTVVFGVSVVLAVAGGIVAKLAAEGGAGGDVTWLGAVMIGLGTVFYIWYTRTMVAICPEVSVLAKAAVCMLVSTLMTLIAADVGVLTGYVPLRYDLSPGNLVYLLWFGAIAVGGSTALWFACGQMIGVTVATMHHNLVPFYVMLFSLAAGGSIEVLTLIGATLVITGAVLAQLPDIKLGRSHIPSPPRGT